MTTRHGSTPVRRVSSPWFLNENRMWSIPIRDRSVACTSCTEVRFSARVIAEFVRRTVAHTPFEPAAGKPHGESGQVMSRPFPWAMGVRPNSAENDDRVVQHAPLLQIDEECGRPAVDFGRGPLDIVFELTVMVPIAVIELNEADAALRQPAGQQAVGGELSIAPLRAVQVEDVFRLVVTSISSGTLVCIWKAISYWLIRVAISESERRRPPSG